MELISSATHPLLTRSISLCVFLHLLPQSGSKYDGDFILGQFHGRGRFVSANLNVGPSLRVKFRSPRKAFSDTYPLHLSLHPPLNFRFCSGFFGEHVVPLWSAYGGFSAMRAMPINCFPGFQPFSGQKSLDRCGWFPPCAEACNLIARCSPSDPLECIPEWCGHRCAT